MFFLSQIITFLIFPMYDFWDTSNQILEGQLVPVHAMKAHGIMEEQIHLFLI
jgi:hypothetical protein